VAPRLDFAQLQLHFVDQIPWRYAVLRPLGLFADRSATARAPETATHPETVGQLKRRVEQQGMLGLLPDTFEVVTPGRRRRVPETVVEAMARLQGLYTGVQYRALARIIFDKWGERVDDKTVQTLWHQSPATAPQQLPLLDYHSDPERAHARLQVMQLYAQSWSKRRISHSFHVSRPTSTAGRRRFEAEELAGLADKSRAPHAPARQTWRPLLIEVYHLQKRHPDAGRFRMWSLLAHSEISERTVGRVMALNKQLYAAIPQVRSPGVKLEPAPPPYKAHAPHDYWFIDGRKMDFAWDGVKWWSRMVLDGYSRTMLAGAVAPTEASWGALLVLYTAGLRYGAPKVLGLDSGGAYISEDLEAVCRRLQSHHEPMVSPQGESSQNLMATHCNIQRRLYDYQVSLTQTPAAFAQAHQACMHTYNTTAHQGLLKEQFPPPIPLEVLGAAKGRLYTPDALARKFVQGLFPRTTNHYGCVTLPSYHVYGEAGVPKTQVLLWVYGEQWRAVLDNVILAAYHCRYDWRTRTVTDMRAGAFYPTRFASPQAALLPINPQESLVLYRPQALRRPTQRSSPAQPLWLFALVHTA
jgi:transposase